MREPVRRACVTAMLLCASCSEPEQVEPPPWASPVAEPTRQEPCVTATENAWFDVAREDGPQPLVISWEEGRASRPSFVLFEDASFLWDPFTWGEPLRRGVLEAEQRDAVHRAFLEARLEDESPIYSRVTDSIDQNAATHCVRRGERWVCATLDGADVRRQSLSASGAYREGPTDSDARPPPDAFVVVQAQIDALARHPSTPLEVSSWLLEVTPWDSSEPMRHAHPWLRELPALQVPALPMIVTIPAERSEKVGTFIRKRSGYPIRLDGRVVYAELIGVAYPGWQTARRVRSAFVALRCSRH